ncbi:ABC transporter ATP-binding protein [Lentibacillus sediminis]|uniref:ABC transporter ATP-binding protein n=1 Tax=Lentibacillus sediminis TaxID=1940529 RepID=UPI000C1C4C62|nr:ABC transporter ATP-binding protein [Lentibacillus sediminis]
MRDKFKKLFLLFNKKEKKKLLILFFMMTIAAVLETLGIGLIVPLVGIVTNPEIIQEQSVLNYLYTMFNFQSTASFIIFAVVLLLAFFVMKNLYLLLFLYAQNRVILNQQVKLSRKMLKEYMIKPYTFHLQRNSSELLRNINKEVPKVFQGIIMAGFQLVTEILVIISILLLLVITAPLATLTAAVILTSSIVIFFKIFRKKISQLGKEQQKVGGTMIKWVNQALGAVKEIKVSGKENFFVSAYTKQSQIKANNNRYLKMLEQSPRLFIETILVSTVLITLLIIVFQGTSSQELVSIMALFAMASFRLMPSITRLIALITSIRVNQPALNVVIEDLFENREEEPIQEVLKGKADAGNEAKSFYDSIILKDISYRYPGQGEYAIKNASLTIPIGKSVAFIGESGAGKSTIVDIILGVLKPEKGNILVDNRKLTDQKNVWQKKIGYIPQFIFLSDDTIRGNIAFGLEPDDIDDQEVWRALEQAQLKEFVEHLPDKLKTNVGERGVRLSGGQRQRVGIARALYHNPEILFMDEATSALDNKTENEIMKAIDGLKGEKTLIIIAHRLTTIKNCDVIYKINKGKIVDIDNRLEYTTMKGG